MVYILGYTYTKLKNNEEAKKAFVQYLELAPEATDRAMVEFYIGG